MARIGLFRGGSRGDAALGPRCDQETIPRPGFRLTHYRATDFRRAEVKEGKQAEFLVYGPFPFDLVDRIGVRSARVQGMAEAAVDAMARRPRIEVRPEWYY
jgi:ssDNA thymidine ADP-ribosyltransferase, DarT